MKLQEASCEAVNVLFWGRSSGKMRWVEVLREQNKRGCFIEIKVPRTMKKGINPIPEESQRKGCACMQRRKVEMGLVVMVEELVWRR